MFLTKRQKISITTILLTLSLFSFPVVDPSLRNYFLAAVIAASYLLSIWSIFQDLKGFEFITLFVLPVLLTSSFGLFILRFSPVTEVRIILSIVYGLVIYTNLLAENIFNVSAERNIPLLRAARTVGYLVTLFVSFAFFSLVYSLGLDWWLFALIALLAGCLIFAQAFWQIELEETPSEDLLIYSAIAGVIMAQLAAAFSFWPLDPPKVGLALTALVYVVLGLLQHVIQEDLTKRAAIEYTFVALSVFLLLILTTSWGI